MRPVYLMERYKKHQIEYLLWNETSTSNKLCKPNFNVWATTVYPHNLNAHSLFCNSREKEYLNKGMPQHSYHKGQETHEYHPTTNQ